MYVCMCVYVCIYGLCVPWGCRYDNCSHEPSIHSCRYKVCVYVCRYTYMYVCVYVYMARVSCGNSDMGTTVTNRVWPLIHCAPIQPSPWAGCPCCKVCVCVHIYIYIYIYIYIFVCVCIYGPCVLWEHWHGYHSHEQSMTTDTLCTHPTISLGRLPVL